MYRLCVLLIICILYVSISNGFPGGAKGASEDGPHHNGTKSQPPETLPYQLSASIYQSGDSKSNNLNKFNKENKKN